jgi:hypothetical protein
MSHVYFRSGLAALLLVMLSVPAFAQNGFPQPTHLSRLIPHGSSSIPDSNQAWGVAIFSLDRENSAARFRISISRTASSILRYELVRIGRDRSSSVLLSLPPLAPVLTADGTLTTLSPAIINALDSGLLSLRISTADYPEGFVSGKIEEASNMVGPVNARQMVPRPADSIGTGFFSGTLDDAARSMRYMLWWEVTSSRATEVRFHRGAAGENGPLLHSVTLPVGDSLLVDTWNGISPDDVAAMKEAKIHVVVVTSRYGEGELRGQLTPVDLFGVAIEPEQVVPPASGTSAQGTGYLYIMGAPSIGYRLSALAAIGETNDSVEEGHIHRGPYGSNGPELAAMSRNRYNAWVFGRNPEIFPGDSAALADLRAGDGYLDFHSDTYPDGELRGQLIPAAFSLSHQTSSVALEPLAEEMRTSLHYDARSNTIRLITDEELRGRRVDVALYSLLGVQIARYELSNTGAVIPAGAVASGVYIARVAVEGRPAVACRISVVR